MGKKGWLSAVKKAVIRSYSTDKKSKKTHRSNSRKSRHGNQMMSFDTYSPQTEANPPMAMEVDQDLEQPENHYVNQPSSIANAAVMADEPADLEQPDDEQMMQHDEITHDEITHDDTAMAEEPADLKQPDDEQIMQHDEITHDEITHDDTAMAEEPADLKQPDDVQIMQPDSTTDHATGTVEEPADVTQVDDEQIMQPDSIADHDATAMEEEPTTPPADDDDDEVVPSTAQFSGKSKEEIAAIKIQTAYRGHMARKDWRVLRARRRVRVMIKGQSVKRQTAATLMCIQAIARVQSQVRSRNIDMAQVNKDLQRQLLQKTKKDIDRVTSEKPAWNLSPKSKEQVEASLRKKRETAERREKALTYIHTHQQIWRNSLITANPTSTEPWGWNWSDRWNVVRPWEPATTSSESVGAMTKSVSSRSPIRSPSKATSSVLKSASSRGSSYSMQSIRGSPNESLRSTSVAKGSTKVGPKISTQAPSRSVPLKKGGSSSKLGVRSTKKQSSLSGSASISRRSTVPRRTITI